VGEVKAEVAVGVDATVTDVELIFLWQKACNWERYPYLKALHRA
jgi:hypothetical protein